MSHIHISIKTHATRFSAYIPKNSLYIVYTYPMCIYTHTYVVRMYVSMYIIYCCKTHVTLLLCKIRVHQPLFNAHVDIWKGYKKCKQCSLLMRTCFTLFRNFLRDKDRNQCPFFIAKSTKFFLEIIEKGKNRNCQSSSDTWKEKLENPISDQPYNIPLCSQCVKFK